MVVVRIREMVQRDRLYIDVHLSNNTYMLFLAVRYG